MAMVKLRECSQMAASDPRSVRSVLPSKVYALTGAKLTLEHRSAGWYPAGAVMRWDDEAWGSMYVTADRDQTRGGRWFKSHDEAKAHFDRF